MKKSLIIIPAIIFLLWISLSFGFSIFWQASVFIFLTFVPGYLLFRFLKIEKSRIIDIFLFSVGLSLAFLMFFGLSINEFYKLMGFSNPLSIIPLGVALTFFTGIMFFYISKRDVSNFSFMQKVKINLSFADAGKVLIISLPVILAVTGALTVSNDYISFPILISMFVLIAILFVLGCSGNKFIPSKLYPYMIFAISLALSLHILLISRFIIGTDAHLEFYVFKLSEFKVLGGSFLLICNPQQLSIIMQC
jgi:uncharacterized membrane protein